MKKLTHTDERGGARMVDVGEKPIVSRMAVAEGWIRINPQALRAVRHFKMKKGDVLTVAQIAGIQAAKHVADLIPLCHPLTLEHTEVRLSFCPGGVKCRSTIHSRGKTGVEMEALAAVSAALLTVYDMCKAVDKKMCIKEICLLEKKKGEVARG